MYIKIRRLTLPHGEKLVCISRMSFCIVFIRENRKGKSSYVYRWISVWKLNFFFMWTAFSRETDFVRFLGEQTAVWCSLWGWTRMTDWETVSDFRSNCLKLIHSTSMRLNWFIYKSFKCCRFFVWIPRKWRKLKIATQLIQWKWFVWWSLSYLN